MGEIGVLKSDIDSKLNKNIKPHFERSGYCSIISMTLVLTKDLIEMGIYDAEDQQDFLEAIRHYEVTEYTNTQDAGMNCHLIDTPIIEFLSNLHSPLSPDTEDKHQSCIAKRRLVFPNGEYLSHLRSAKKRKPDEEKLIGYDDTDLRDSGNFRISLFPTPSDLRILNDDHEDDESDINLDFIINQMRDIVEEKEMEI